MTMSVGKVIECRKEEAGYFTLSSLVEPSNPRPQPLLTSKLITFVCLIKVFITHTYCASHTCNKGHHLEKSLSQTLSQYYLFAGRLPMQTPTHMIDCNDDGVVFLEANNNSKMEDVINVSEQDETTRGQLFPDGLQHMVTTMAEEAGSPLNKPTRVEGIRSYTASNLCRFPFTKVDFGWGKPVGVCEYSNGIVEQEGILLFSWKLWWEMVGIDAQVTLERKEMDMTYFKNDRSNCILLICPKRFHLLL